MDFAPATPKSVSAGLLQKQPPIKLNLQPLQLDESFHDVGGDGHDGDQLLQRSGRVHKVKSAPMVLGHSAPSSEIVHKLIQNPDTQRRRALQRVRIATPAAAAGNDFVESGTVDEVCQKLLDIFWPSRLRQQMLSVSPLSCSYFDM